MRPRIVLIPVRPVTVVNEGGEQLDTRSADRGGRGSWRARSADHLQCVLVGAEGQSVPHLATGSHAVYMTNG